MCGIVGFCCPAGDGEAQAWLDAAVAAIAHRGPDGTGTCVRRQVALGHARLAIIDLEGGAQPMSSAGGALALTYNGELYNFRELRSELEARGHRFRTRSDTEVILLAYEEWGPACVERFRGMFAFALADHRRRKLFLARDHLGIKPLLYVRVGDRFAFASEVAALRSLPWVAEVLEPDPQGLYLCLRFGYCAAPQSAIRPIRKLAPGHWMEIDVDAPECRPRRYWHLRFRPDHSRRPGEWDEAVDAALRESVQAHLVSDVPFGAFLSGGLDSTLVTAYMAELLDEPVKTFTIGFEHEEFDERRYALQASDTLGTEHYTEVVEPHSMELLGKLVRHYGEPFGDASAIPTWHVSRLARQHVPMVLSGDGGDELFAGYASYRAWLRKLHPDRPLWKAVLRPLLATLHPRRFQPDRDRRRQTLTHWLRHANFVSEDDMRGLWRRELQELVRPWADAAERAFAETEGLAPMIRARSVDLQTYLPSDILTKVDVAAMMHGLEVRTPLTDVRVAELAATIPPEILIQRSGRRGRRSWNGKLPIRRLLSRRFPDGFVRRPKQGFGVPLERWLFDHEGGHVADRLLDPASPIYDWLQPAAVAGLLRRRHGLATWNLLVLDEWLRQHEF